MALSVKDSSGVRLALVGGGEATAIAVESRFLRGERYCEAKGAEGSLQWRLVSSWPLQSFNHGGRKQGGSRRAGRCRRPVWATRRRARGCRLRRRGAGGAGSCRSRRRRGLPGGGWSSKALVPPSRLGAILICGARLLGAAIARTSSAVRLGMSVGRTRTLAAPRVTT